MKQTNKDWLEWLVLELEFTVWWKTIPPEEKQTEKKVIKYRQVWSRIESFLEYFGDFV